MTARLQRIDPRTDPAVVFSALEILDDQLDQSWPELAEELKDRVARPEQFGPPTLEDIPAGWTLDWGDVARLVLDDLHAADPPLIERAQTPVEGMPGDRPWPAAARRFRLTTQGQRQLERQRT